MHHVYSAQLETRQADSNQGIQLPSYLSKKYKRDMKIAIIYPTN